MPWFPLQQFLLLSLCITSIPVTMVRLFMSSLGNDRVARERGWLVLKKKMDTPINFIFKNILMRSQFHEYSYGM